MALRPVGRFEWEHLVRRVIMTPRVKLTALTMATYADPDGTRVRPGFDLLAAVTGQSDSTVRRSVKALRDLGLLDLVTRGGGRSGRGKATEYRLAVPEDLLDRAELLPPGGFIPAGAMTKREAKAAPCQSEPAEPNDRSEEAASEGLSGQNDGMSGHGSDQLPATPPTTTDQINSSRLPTQPPTASEDTQQPNVARSRKCEHGLPAHQRDGEPTCPLCRRDQSRPRHRARGVP